MPGSRSREALKSVAAVGAVLLLAWIFWPAARVANLNSGGSAIVAFGDSLTAGYGAAAGEDYPSKLSQDLGTPVINAGVSGDTTEAALARVDDVLAQNPRIVIVGLGGNDFLRNVPIATTEANLRAIIGKVHDAGAMVVLLGFRFPSLGRGNYEAMYERVADDTRSLLIPDLLDGILANQKLKSDEIHPNGAGYALMAERVSGPLRKLIGRADGAR